jgi:hypothetical protein
MHAEKLTATLISPRSEPNTTNQQYRPQLRSLLSTVAVECSDLHATLDNSGKDRHNHDTRQAEYAVCKRRYDLTSS